MSRRPEMKTLAAAIATALAANVATISAATMDENPFSMTQLSSGYMVADAHEGKCGEGKCGEGKCGMKMKDADGDGVVTKEEFMAAAEKKFASKDANGDGKLTADEMGKHSEGKCGEGKCGGKSKEGKCGEGKCGGKKE